MNLSFIHQVSEDDLKAWLRARNEPSFRAKQISEWLWKHGVFDVDLMTNLSLQLRDKLQESFILCPLTLVRSEGSNDGETTKFLWKLCDGAMVESVLIRAPGRCTVCVSSQVGCPVRCSFCASGKHGFIRNLCAAEIAGQVLAVQQQIVGNEERITNIVYMGMGEPLRNYEAVVESIRLLSDSAHFGMSKRRITVSTVGVVENILRLAHEGIGVNLALSLHAPRQELRQKLIPYARDYDLEEVMKAVDTYHLLSGRDITYEYILIAGVNDRIEDAMDLCSLLRGRQGTVNLIPYNTVSGLKFRRSSTTDISAFRQFLDKMGVVNTCRYTKGDDIGAACGQLALAQAEQGEGDGAV